MQGAECKGATICNGEGDAAKGEAEAIQIKKKGPPEVFSSIEKNI